MTIEQSRDTGNISHKTENEDKLKNITTQKAKTISNTNITKKYRG